MRCKVLDLDDFMIFAAINDAEREQESLHDNEWLTHEAESEPGTFSWIESAKHEEENSERDWYQREREQIKWEMENADIYGFDKENIQQRLNYLDDTENT